MQGQNDLDRNKKKIIHESGRTQLPAFYILAKHTALRGENPKSPLSGSLTFVTYGYALQTIRQRNP